MLFNSIRDAINQIRCNKYTSFSAIGIISIILLIFGLFLLSLHNLHVFAELLKRDMEVTAFSSGSTTTQQLNDIKTEIEAMKEAEAVVLISKDDALGMFSRDITNIEGVIQGLKENPLPDTFRIKIVPESRNPDDMRELSDRLLNINGIDEVVYGKEWVERLDAIITAMRVLSIIVAGIMLLLVLFIMSNAIRLTFLVRRDEIEIMKLAGATRLFIRIPYIIEGGILGLLSAASSVIILYAVYRLIIFKIPSTVYLWLGGIEFSFITLSGIAVIILTGMVVGCFASWTSVGRLIGIALFLFLCFNNKDIHALENKSGQSIEQEIQKSQKQLSDVNKQIDQNKRASKKASEDEKKVKRKLEGKEKDLGSKKGELNKINRDIVRKKKEIRTVHQNVESLSSDLDAKRIELSTFIREIYKSSMWRYSSSAEILLSSSNYNDYKIKLRYQDSLISEANRLMSNMGEDINELNGKLSSLNKRHQNLVAVKSDIAEDKKIIERDIKKERRELVSIQKKKSEYDLEIKRLTSASEALKKLITSYEKERSRDMASAGRGLAKYKGKLVWPLDGEVVSSFGRQKHPEFDEYIFKKGIEIEAKGSNQIRAAFDGVVAYADWLQGYGLTVIIDHGNSYYTIYGHASKISVSKGKKVKKGQVVAIAGRGNSSDRDGIYFELRHQGEVVDPIAWLARG